MKIRLGRRSVASITAALKSIVDELNSHAQEMIKEADHHRGHVEKHSKLHAEAQAEQAKALAAAEKIAALLA